VGGIFPKLGVHFTGNQGTTCDTAFRVAYGGVAPWISVNCSESSISLLHLYFALFCLRKHKLREALNVNPDWSDMSWESSI
jgi:hypothetical protein